MTDPVLLTPLAPEPDKRAKTPMGFIIHHFSSTTYNRTPQQLEREQWLIPGLVKFNRYYLMPAALLIQLCVGSLYAWSGYNLPIEAAIFGTNLVKDTPVDRNIASVTFYIAVAVFGCTAAILGPWLERHGPFQGTLLGASLFYAGNLLTALAVYTKQIWLVYVGYGVVSGMGLGIGYISPVSPLQKWFPEMRGVAAGLAVCGFGGGSVIAPFTQLALIGPNYTKDLTTVVGVPLTFIILGSAYFVIMILSGLVLRMPPPGYQVKGITIETIAGAEGLKSHASSSNLLTLTEEKKQTTSGEKKDDTNIEDSVPKPSPTNTFSISLPQALTSKEFWLMYAMFFGSQMAGLLMISKIQSIVINQLGQSATIAAMYNSGLSGMNLLGRLLLPAISDWVGRKPLFIFSLFAQAFLVGFLPTAIHLKSFPGVITCAFIIGLVYGAGFGMIPAFLADQFGSKNVGATHGVILTSWSLTGVAGAIIFNTVLKTENARLNTSTPEGKPNLIYVYDINMYWVLAVICFSFFVCLFIPVNLRDRKIPKIENEKFRFRGLNGRMIRVMKGFKFVQVSKDQEEQEWKAFLASINVQ